MDRKGVFAHIKWFIILLIPISLVWGMRLYVVESFRISTPAMEDALFPGDYVLVQKYNSSSPLQRYAILLYESPLIRDSISSPLFLSRCIGQPGDTVLVDGKGYLINGTFYPTAPQTLNEYKASRSIETPFLSAIKKLDIPQRNLSINDSTITLSLTAHEEKRIRDYLQTACDTLLFHVSAIKPYALVLPRKERFYRITPESLPFYMEAIRKETCNKAVFKDGKLYLDGRECSFYYFRNNYYWLLSDNRSEAIDSRQLGIVPDNCIVGKIWYRWYHDNKLSLKKFIE